MHIDELHSNIDLLVDTGADISLIKLSNFLSNTDFYGDVKIKISGLSTDNIETLGYCFTNIRINDSNYKALFHIVKDNFPIPYEGILGNDIITDLGMIINNKSKSIQIGKNRIPLNIYETPLTKPNSIQENAEYKKLYCQLDQKFS